MDIVRNSDGTLVVPVEAERQHTDEATDGEAPPTSNASPGTRVIHPGEGGYDEALAEWDRQQHPDHEVAVSTASGRQEAMAVVHAVAESEDHAVAPALALIGDPEASGEALRHVLVGGVPSVDAFAHEVAEAEGGEPLPAHEATKIIGQVLGELDK
jgi:hypothetical protein